MEHVGNLTRRSKLFRRACSYIGNRTAVAAAQTPAEIGNGHAHAHAHAHSHILGRKDNCLIFLFAYFYTMADSLLGFTIARQLSIDTLFNFS